MDEVPDSSGLTEVKPSYYRNFRELVDKTFNIENPPRLVLMTHSYPDPDALGSIMSFEWLINKLYPKVEIVSYFDGSISHPQNIAMFNLLDPNSHHIKDYVAKSDDFNVLVDTVPANAGLGENKVNFNLVIDHHKEIPNGGFNGLFINLKAGSCCATIYNLIKLSELAFSDDVDLDSRVATAILIGVSTDTENLMSDDATQLEFDAWAELFEFRNPTVLKKIVNFERPKFWIEHKAAAVENAEISEGLGVVGLGIIPAKHRDMIADMADNMVSWEDVNTAVAFAIVDGDKIVGCVRSRNASVMVPNLCKELAGKYGSGGGKLGRGAYHYPLAGGSFEEEDEDQIKEETWKLHNAKEKKRIMRIVRK
jgi:nanoRNase/pAp phosphatase (c-di-AMP/oligoRNAs hydrolase)